MPSARSIAVTLLAAPSLLLAQITQDTPGCSRLDIPERIAAINDLLDVPLLSQELARRDIGMDPVHALVSVLFDERGAPEHVRVLASSVDSATDRGVRDAVAAAVVSQPPADRWGIRVLLVLGAAPKIQFERAELCPPQPLDLSLRAQAAPTGDGVDAVRLRMLVNERGRVAQSTVVQSSGDGSVDERVQAYWRRIVFDPGTLDGVPVEAWYETGDDIQQ